jgi:hypothetical protein
MYIFDQPQQEDRGRFRLFVRGSRTDAMNLFLAEPQVMWKWSKPVGTSHLSVEWKDVEIGG